MSRVELRGVRKVYPTGVTAVDGIDLTVDDGEVVVLLGPTGCGKTTVLRLIAGLETPTDGEIRIGEDDVDGVVPSDRGLAMVFQEYALYPHLSVADNIGFPLMHVDEAERTARVADVAHTLGLDGLLQKRPGQLSGGQRQRVAMARAIARPPRAFLLDQPLSNLDATARDVVRTDVLDLVRSLGVATVYVTHDQEEAMIMADRVGVMRRGRIEQLGTPAEVYSDPSCLFVAAFVGSPRMNLLQAAVYAERDVRTVIDLGPQVLDLPWDDPRARALAEHHTARITVGIRPDVRIMAPTAAPCASSSSSGSSSDPGSSSPSRSPSLKGVVRLVELRGHDALVHLDTGCSPTPHLLSHLELPDAPGELTNVVSEPLARGHSVRDRLMRFVPQQRTAEELGRYAVQPAYDAQHDHARHILGDFTVLVPAERVPRTGDTLEIEVDIEHLYFFDGTGERIRLPAVAVAEGPARASLAAPARNQEGVNR
jgi:multiple sugar transport system ATP-binding protein